MANENAVTTVTEQSQITAKLLSDYFATLTDRLTEVQRNQFAAVAQAFGLNPFKREIYATTYRNKDGQTVMSIVTGYEVYLKRAEMNPNYNGFETNFQVVNGEMGCTCKVYRKDRTMPVTSTVWMSEYSTGRSLWASKPRMMLEKVAIATAFRRAFPCDFGGMPYTTDELPEHMTGADKLEQQGFTEVPQDVARPQAPAKPKAAKKVIDEETKKFLEDMEGLYTQSQEIYKKTMEEFGFNKALSIPVERRGEVFNTIVANISKAAQHQSAPTAEEQTDNGEVDNSLF
jgi:phage recombination protein Bet